MLSPRDLFPSPPPLGKVGDAGLFGPASAAWRLGRERLVLVGGPAALLMQVAHPLVAAGVAEHSDFAEDPLRRLRGTLGAALTVTFGDRDQVEAAAVAVARRHQPVHGELGTDLGGFAAGSAYRADDPELAMWVFATLIWTAVRVHDSLLAPVPLRDRDDYYADMRQFGRLFGAVDALMPANFAGLDDFVQRMASDVLVVGPVAHRLASQILDPEPPLLPAPLRSLPAVLAAGLLPPELRDAYGLAWGPGPQRLFATIRAASPLAVRALPAPLRFWPHYRTAVRRIRLS